LTYDLVNLTFVYPPECSLGLTVGMNIMTTLIALINSHNGVETFFFKSGLNFHPPAISQYIFSDFQFNEKLNNFS